MTEKVDSKLVPASREDIYGLLVGTGRYEGMKEERRIQIWSRWVLLMKRKSVNLSHYDFSERNVGGFNFSNFILKKTHFKGNSLTSNNFRETDLREAQFKNVHLIASVLDLANLKQASFFNVKIGNCDFVKANLERANFNGDGGPNTAIYNCTFVRANLQEARFYNVEMSRVNFRDANLKNTKFEKCELKEINFENSNINITQLKNCILKDVKGLPGEKGTLSFTTTEGGELSKIQEGEVSLIEEEKESFWVKLFGKKKK